MPTSYKILGQVATSGGASVDLYTSPNNVNAVCSTLSACAIGNTSYLRVACVPSGQTIAQKNYIVYDTYVNQYDTLFLTLGVTMSSGDKMTVYASGGGPVAFSLFGSEIY
jgi:hypothetical protein